MKLEKFIAFAIGGGVTVINLALANPSQAASITTTFASNNQADANGGNMFDITTSGNPLNVTSLAVNVVTTGTFNLQVYTKPGTYVGSETNSVPWTLVSSVTGITGQGQDNPTLVDIPDFNLSASSLTGIYIATNTALRYTNGVNTYSNADLQLDLGAGLNGLFGTGTGVFSPRTWNGTINYDAQTVPEPSSLIGLVTLAALGGGSLLKRRLEK